MKKKFNQALAFILFIPCILFLFCKPDIDNPNDPFIKDDISQNAALSNLKLSEGTLSPEFDKEETEYTLKLEKNISSIIITPVLEGLKA